jgi:calpain-15
VTGVQTCALPILIDDRFPYDTHKETWAFTRPRRSRNEIWVLILEKAWAKVFGSYQRIEAGTTGEALQPLTGCPTKSYVHEDSDYENLWKVI